MAQSRVVVSGQIWTPEGFVPGQVWIQDRKITAVEYHKGAANVPGELNYSDAYITPGLLDLQLNGGIGYDFTRDPETMSEVAAALPRWGVTGFLPTFITASLSTYYEAFAIPPHKINPTSAEVLGAHVEGPYLSAAYRGAHDVSLIRDPSLKETLELLKAQDHSSLKIRMTTIAPEKPGALEVIRELVKHGVIVAVGHSAATYEEALKAFEAGASCITHLFNAMSSLHHRQPGLVGAALEDNDIIVNLIVDGIHLHPAIVRLIYRLKGWQRILLVTDSMAGMGMAPGTYELAGQSVIVDHDSARLTNSPATLAGSILTLDHALANMVEFVGCPAHEAVAMATLVPAKMLGLDQPHETLPAKGRLAAGYDADIAIFTPEFKPLLTMIGGQVAYKA